VLDVNNLYILSTGAKLEGGGGGGGGYGGRCDTPQKYESSGLAEQSKILNDRM
jgi:DUF917 family protein